MSSAPISSVDTDASTAPGDRGMDESATSHALRLLRAHRVVTVRRVGRRLHYSLRDGHGRMIFDMALEHARQADTVTELGA